MTPAIHSAGALSFCRCAEQVADQIRKNMPVTATEKRLASQLRDKLFKDKQWVREYLDGSRKCATELEHINIILASRVTFRLSTCTSHTFARRKAMSRPMSCLSS
jgi:hypothetical protein